MNGIMKFKIETGGAAHTINDQQKPNPFEGEQVNNKCYHVVLPCQD